jgi:glycosyltransferase involved in cell wall biosynthesis
MVILMFGRLEPYKGLDVLASAMPRVWESHPHAELIIAGAGPTEFALVDDPRVTLRSGYIPEAEIADLFAAATVAVLPYTQASQSGVASVSLGLGVPVVASDIGGLPDLVETEWLSQPGDPLALAERLNRGLQHTYHHREEILGRVRALYSWDAVGLRFTTVYSELVVKRGRRHVTRRLGAARERNPWS